MLPLACMWVWQPLVGSGPHQGCLLLRCCWGHWPHVAWGKAVCLWRPITAEVKLQIVILHSADQQRNILPWSGWAPSSVAGTSVRVPIPTARGMELGAFLRASTSSRIPTSARLLPKSAPRVLGAVEAASQNQNRLSLFSSFWIN